MRKKTHKNYGSCFFTTTIPQEAAAEVLNSMPRIMGGCWKKKHLARIKLLLLTPFLETLDP